MSLLDLETCCRSLDSSKITTRKRNAELLQQLLETAKVINLLNNSHSEITWDFVVDSVNKYLLKEANKLREDEQKKAATNTARTFCGNLLVETLRSSHKTDYCLKVRQVLHYIFLNFESMHTRKYFADAYLTVLRDYILSVQKYWGKITREDWLKLLCLIKDLIERPLSTLDINKSLSCFYYIVKYGSNHRLPSLELHKQFEFVTKLVKKLSDSTLRWKHETVLNILLVFCEKTAEDNRMACCKLGEELFPALIAIYQQSTHNLKIKNVLLEFWLLQMQLHHPKGSLKNTANAYAFSPAWQLRLQTLYSILYKEIDDNMQIRNKSSLNLDLDFTTFHTVCLKLTVEVVNQVIHEETVENGDNEPEAKKPKLQCGISIIIDNIRDQKKWPWVKLMKELLIRYPAIKAADFVHLLHILYVLQSETKDSDLFHHIYECVCVLVGIQHLIADLHEKSMDSLWQLVWESSMRAAGLNQEEEVTHQLLQNLLKRGKASNLANFYQTYISRVMNVSQFSLATLNVAFEQFGFPEVIQHNSVPHKTREVLLNWILKAGSESNTFVVYTEKITAEILVNLTLKHWHRFDQIDEQIEKTMTVEDVYIISSLGEIPRENADEKRESMSGGKKNSIAHADIYEKLLKSATDIADSFLTLNDCDEQFTSNLLRILVFLAHLISCLVEVQVIDEATIDECVLTSKMQQLLITLLDIFTNNFAVLSEKTKFELLTQMKVLLCANLNAAVSSLCRKMFPVDLLRVFFNMLNENEESLWKDKNARLLSMQILCDFACCANVPFLNITQHHVIETLAKPDFDPHLTGDCQMMLEFLSSVWKCQATTLPDSVLDLTGKSIQQICTIHYTDFETALKILEVLKKLLLHITNASIEIKNSYIDLLQPFFQQVANYGPAVSKEVINCMVQLAKLDPNLEWAKWDGEPIVVHLVDFLSSNFHSVRIAATQAIRTLFSKSLNVKETSIYSVKLQGSLLERIYEQSNKVFCLEGNFSEEQQIDESVSRTASVLLTYASLIVTSAVWRKPLLFTLLKLVHVKRINDISIASILRTVAHQLDAKDLIALIEHNLNYILINWFVCQLPLQEFPYTLLNQHTFNDFQRKYFLALLPFRIEDSVDVLREELSAQQTSLERTVEVKYPEMIAQYFAVKTQRETQNAFDHSLVFILNYSTFLDDVLPNKLPAIVAERTDEIVEHLIKLIHDVDHFKLHFDVDLMLAEVAKPWFSVGLILNTLVYVGTLLPERQPVIEYCMTQPKQVQSIIMSLSKAIAHAHSVEDQLLAFHRFTVFVNLILDSLDTNADLSVYVIRSISYILLNLIMQSDASVLSVIACRFMQKFLATIFTTFAHVFNEFFTIFVSSLVPMARKRSIVSAPCLQLLEFIVVDNCGKFEHSFTQLDPFPEDAMFKRMRAIYVRIKYKKACTLEEEIEAFLATSALLGRTGNRIEGLRHLRNELGRRKGELSRLYKKIAGLKGLCDVSEQSVMHRFTYALMKLTMSTDEQECVEATRCLGELGSADLLTVVLHTEKHEQLFHFSYFDLVTKEILLLLNDYLVDANVAVVEGAAIALYDMLAFKEAKRVLTAPSVNIVDASTHNCAGLLGNNEDTQRLNQHYFTPFISMAAPKRGSQFMLKHFEVFSEQTLWCPRDCSHEKWITTLTCRIIDAFDDNCYLKSLKPLCLLQVDFAERIFALLIYILMYRTNTNQKQTTASKSMAQCIQHFFNSKVAIRESVQCMLNMLNLIRTQSYLTKMRSLADLHLNYLHVAEAAEFCSDPFGALWYAELWCQERKITIKETNTRPLNLLETIYEHSDPAEVDQLHNILQKCYRTIGETDALNSLGAMHLLDRNLRIEHYKQLKLWDQVVLHYDLEVGRGQRQATPTLVDALKSSALFHLPLEYANGAQNQYECLWRLNRWDLSAVNANRTNADHCYDKYQYYALKSLHDDDWSAVDECVAEARNCVVDAVRKASLASTRNVYALLTQLQSLRELEDCAAARRSRNFSVVLEKWRAQDHINANEFQFVEPIRAQRVTMLKDCAERQRDLNDELVASLLKLAELARSENNTHIAIRSLHSLANIVDLSDEMRFRTHLEEAQVHWLVNQPTGKSILHNLLNKPMSQSLRAFALKLYGTWMVNTKSINSHTIIKDYFLASLDILTSLREGVDNGNSIMDAYIALARFADNQYQQVLAYIKSPTFECKVQNMERAKRAALEIKNKKDKLTKDEERAAVVHERHSAIDQGEIASAQMEKNMYLTLALKYYLNYLSYCPREDVSIFRILSLWLENRGNAEVATLMREYLKTIASYKFLLVLPQLVPHISSNDDVFSQTISGIIRKCANEHPHHTIPVILAVANSHKDTQFDTSNTVASSNEPRIIEANKIIAELLRQPATQQLVQRMKLVSEALIGLAYYSNYRSADDDTTVTFPIPRLCGLQKIKGFDDVLLPTYTLPYNKAGNYSHIVGIHSFERTFTIVGGINSPKRIKCLGTDGILRDQLVKGMDDLRQDAVMQQVFTIINNLLRRETRMNLVIRTYKVVPLSQRSGILEWVNSMPIGNYLIEAHAKYNPDDVRPRVCREAFEKAQKTTTENKRRVYTWITSKLRPVFHKFFETTFLEPTVYYERRRAYMMSVATSSMCGYILGLGDRHVQNILLDKRTAEVIHIDFGIAFEQGKILPTPETVPFRLTRDMEDGMGVLGIEGVFRRSCEKTMEMLRSNAETIVSILEVLLYDPLYAWAITPAEAYNRQHSNEEEKENITFSDNDTVPVNVTAERALLRLRQKLQGTEEGSASSVEGQVEKLIQEARDPANLCRLFYGWQPYL